MPNSTLPLKHRVSLSSVDHIGTHAAKAQNLTNGPRCLRCERLGKGTNFTSLRNSATERNEFFITLVDWRPSEGTKGSLCIRCSMHIRSGRWCDADGAIVLSGKLGSRENAQENATKVNESPWILTATRVATTIEVAPTESLRARD